MLGVVSLRVPLFFDICEGGGFGEIRDFQILWFPYECTFSLMRGGVQEVSGSWDLTTPRLWG